MTGNVRFGRGLFLAATAAGLAFRARPGGAQELQEIKIAAPANDTATSALYAIKAGLFKKVGLNVEITAMNSGAAVASAVAGGAVQIGNSSLISIMEARQRRIAFSLVATSGMIETDVPYAALVVAKNSPIKSAKDLDGKTLASPALRDLNAISMAAWMDQNGGDSTTAKFIELSAAASMQAVADGRVDAAIIGTPFLQAGIEAGQLRILGKAFDAVAKRFIHIGWFTTDDWAAKNRDAVEKFARVMHEAAVYCNAHQKDTTDLIIEFGKVDPKLAPRLARVTFAEYLTAKDIQPLVDVAAKYHAIEKSFDAQEMISPFALKPPR